MSAFTNPPPDDHQTLSSQFCIDYKNVEEAYTRIKNIVNRTPVFTSTSLESEHGKNLFFKAEALQRTGSFKFRGAMNATLSILEDHDKHKKYLPGKKHSFNLVTHSSGNHAAAVALAAKLGSEIYCDENINVNATIVMPKNAPQIKKNAVKGFGGEIILVDNTNEAREEMADRVVGERDNSFFVHPSEDPRVIAGQGTVSVEMVSQVEEIISQKKTRSGHPSKVKKTLDAVIIPVGGGGLASGNTIALRGLLGNDVKIILAEPAEMDDAKRSKEAGRLLGHDKENPLNSVADGLKTTLGTNTWPVVRDLVDDIFTVSEDEILRATKKVWERLKVCIEPSAGVGVAVALGKEFNEKYTIEGGINNVGIILCGGNVDIIKISKLMEEKGL